MNVKRFAFLVFLFATVILFALIFSLQNRPTRVYAQSNVTATPTLSVVELQATVDALSTQVAYQATQVGLNKQAVEIKSLSDVQNIVLWATVISIIAIVFGLASPFVAIRWAQDEIRKRLNSALYRADPSNLPIYVPKKEFEREKSRLVELGFENLRSYTALAELQLQGIVIYPAKLDRDKSGKTLNSSKDADVLIRFIQKHKADSRKVAFVIYTTDRIPPDLFNSISADFDTYVFANSPVTLAMHIYSLGRLLMA